MNKITKIINTSVKAIFVNKMQSFLTMLGIIIGIGAVIALMGIGSGAQESIISQISSLGLNTVTVYAQGNKEIDITQSKLTQKDYEYLSNPKRFQYIQYVSPITSSSGGTSGIYKDNSVEISIKGVDVSYQYIEDITFRYGSFFNSDDVLSKKNTIVIGSSVARDLFGSGYTADVLNEYISVNGVKYRIKGIMAEKESTSMGDPNYDCFLPYTTVMGKISKTDSFSNIVYMVTDEKLVDITNDSVKEKFSSFRNVDPLDPNFRLFSASDLQDTASQVTSIFTSLLSGIAAISLVVGGIGIMNIMFVSVTQRTREIGLRKALGAQSYEVLLQFLIESIILTLIGGILGILLGIGLGFLLGQILGFTAVISVSSILMATGISASIGIVFGFYPAFRASKLDPIVALRSE